jgi:subtilase family serine protease
MKKDLSLACLLVLCISIASNMQVPVTRSVSATENGLPSASLPLEALGPDSTTPIGLTPAEIRSVYNLPSTGGQGTIAIIDAYDDPTILNDANVFSKQYGLTNLTSTNFEKHEMGSVLVDDSWAEEISLDVEWAHAIAPKAKILLVEAVDSSPTDLFNAVDYARSRTDVIAISMSWGEPETALGLNPKSLEAQYDSILQPLGNKSCCFFAGSGDHCENVSYPACSPNVVAVGGTMLNFNDGSFASETVWYSGASKTGGTGGGVSQFETEPSYQVLYGVQGSNGHRGVPDVSFDAGTPVSVYDSTLGPLGQYWIYPVTGTSIGAPCWAAIYSDGLTASNNILYICAKSTAYHSDFRDITSGNNGLYSAGIGYDFCTGLGSPLTTKYDLPPNIPSTPSGPTSVFRNVWNNYTTSTTDPDGDNVCYQFEFTGPSTNKSVTTDFYASGKTMLMQVMWQPSDPLGTYQIRVRAQDVYGLWSGWSSSLTVNLLANLTVLAGWNGMSLTTGYVYIDGQYVGRTGSTFTVTGGTHTVRVTDFWESGNTGYRYGFTNWENGSTANPRNITVNQDTTITANFKKKYCPGDCDGNGVVNELDLAIVEAAWYSSPGSTNWDSRADCDGNGFVDINDLSIVAQNIEYYKLGVLAEDLNGNNVTTGYVYIGGTYVGRTGSTFTVMAGTRTVFVDNVCWGIGNFAGYRYTFQHWENGSTANPRTIWLNVSKTITASFNKKYCPGDVNGDGVVNWVDQGILGLAYGSTPGNSNWDSRADLNGDGHVNWIDLAILGLNYGNVYP